MKVRKLIEELAQIEDKHGDIDIYCMSQIEPGKAGPISHFYKMHSMDDEVYMLAAQNPNWPSKTGEKSGDNRGNNKL
ncbi:hypothetical protein HOP60_02850 [Halomonas daqingensis]|uniref:Uncharacterized protein n=1 Tax=Billgrantia desiderata TaxID=52021 RepID=A0ABS9B0C7_9GAMM|nr:hypothetical protein [Halomonas desiderata]MCE8041089.1 hypothetical protein [Halomonas desiderata]MCE8045664.1 hypothetical protein [Halomonas desiderata]